MTESFPQYTDKPVEIQLRTKHEPDEVALRLLAVAREQLALQQIVLEVILVDGSEAHSDGCGCGHGGCHD